MMFNKLPIDAITALSLAIGLISCDATPSVNFNSGTENNSVVNTSDTVTAERPLVVATTNVLYDLTFTLKMAFKW